MQRDVRPLTSNGMTVKTHWLLIRTIVQQEKKQGRAELSLVGMLRGGAKWRRLVTVMFGDFDVNKMNIWHVYTSVSCPIIKFQMMVRHRLAEILTLVRKWDYTFIQLFIEHRWSPLWRFMGANLHQSCIILVLGFQSRWTPLIQCSAYYKIITWCS